MWDTLPSETYYKGNVCMLGDAAHATTPFQGQGAGQALEDSFVLESLMSLVDKPEEVAFAFKAYDKIRRPRTQKIVKTSREMGEIVALRLPGIQDHVKEFKVRTHGFNGNLSERYLLTLVSIDVAGEYRMAYGPDVASSSSSPKCGLSDETYTLTLCFLGTEISTARERRLRSFSTS